MKNFFFSALLLIMSVSFLHAAPSINTVSGTPSHKSTITISGSDFGSKSPAAPLWWDDGEGAANGQDVATSGGIPWVISGRLSGTSKHYNSAEPHSVTQNGGAANLTYRTPSYRNVNAPHPYSSKIMAGGHDDEGECQTGPDPGANVGITISGHYTAPKWYVRHYLRLDPLFPAPGNGHNLKMSNWETESPYTMYKTNNYDGCGTCAGGYNNMLRAPNCPGANYTTPRIDLTQMIATDEGVTCDWDAIITYDTSVPSEQNQWVSSERFFDNAQGIYRIVQNNRVMGDTELDTDSSECDCRTRQAGNPNPGAITIGGFWKKQHCNGTLHDRDDNAWRYFDDIYVDTSWSRVVLANNATYSNATIVEPQIPSGWNNSSITCTVNLGRLSTQGNAYLFVFDSNNNHNPTGYPISIVGGGGNTTSSIYPTDSIPPDPPTGLRLEDL